MKSKANQGKSTRARNAKLALEIATIVSFQLAASQTMSQANCEVLKVAQEYIARQYPSFDPSGLKPIITETGNLWEVTYELPAGMLGGVPIVILDKRTCTVIRAQHSQ